MRAPVREKIAFPTARMVAANRAEAWFDTESRGARTNMTPRSCIPLVSICFVRPPGQDELLMFAEIFFVEQSSHHWLSGDDGFELIESLEELALLLAVRPYSMVCFQAINHIAPSSPIHPMGPTGNQRSSIEQLAKIYRASNEHLLRTNPHPTNMRSWGWVEG